MRKELSFIFREKPEVTEFLKINYKAVENAINVNGNHTSALAVKIAAPLVYSNISTAMFPYNIPKSIQVYNVPKALIPYTVPSTALLVNVDTLIMPQEISEI